MSSLFAVIVNDVPHLEFDRNKPLPEPQLRFIEKMDKELSAQIVIGNEKISNPDTHQRAQFVAINLINALRTGNDTIAAAMCSYLALRVPDLKLVRASDVNNEVLIDLVFDEDYVRQIQVDFQPRSSDKTTKH